MKLQSTAPVEPQRGMANRCRTAIAQNKMRGHESRVNQVDVVQVMWCFKGQRTPYQQHRAAHRNNKSIGVHLGFSKNQQSNYITI